MFLHEHELFTGLVDIFKLLDLLDIEYKHEGDELIASCPNHSHEDKNPSWSININHNSPMFGVHNCFSCGFKGGIISLISETLRVSDDKANGWLNSKFGLDIDNIQARDMICDIYIPKASNKKIDLLDIKRIRKFVNSLSYIEVGDRFYKYLISRGVTSDQIKRHKPKKVIEGFYSNRVLFPLRNIRGNIISFYARSILKNIDKGNKGLYPRGKNTISNVLFGYEYIVEDIDSIILLEGVPDMLSVERSLGLLHKNNIGNPIAIMGGRITDKQISLIKNKFNRFYIFPDGDAGGGKFKRTAIRKLKGYGEIFVIETPLGLDPGELSEDKILELFLNADLKLARSKFIVRCNYGI